MEPLKEQITTRYVYEAKVLVVDKLDKEWFFRLDYIPMKMYVGKKKPDLAPGDTVRLVIERSNSNG